MVFATKEGFEIAGKELRGETGDGYWRSEETVEATRVSESFVGPRADSVSATFSSILRANKLFEEMTERAFLFALWLSCA